MQSLYNTADDFAAYASQQSSQRLIAIVHMASSAIFFAGRTLLIGPNASGPIARLTADDLYDLTKHNGLKELASVESIELSMDWLAKQAEGTSKRLFNTLRQEWADMGLWTIEQQAPRQGKQQRTTKLFDIDFRAVFNVARAAIVRLIEMHELGKHPEFWTLALFPSHEFGFLNAWFTKIFGFFLKASDEVRSMQLSNCVQFLMKRIPTFQEVENYARRLMGLPPIGPVAEKKPPTKPENWGVLSDDPIWNDLPY